MVNKKTKKRRVNINGRNDTKKRRGNINGKITKKKSYQRLKKTQKGGGWWWSKNKTPVFTLYDKDGKNEITDFKTMQESLYELLSKHYKDVIFDIPVYVGVPPLNFKTHTPPGLGMDAIEADLKDKQPNIFKKPTEHHFDAGMVEIESTPFNRDTTWGRLYLYCNRCEFKKENKESVFKVYIFYIIVTKDKIYELPAYINIPVDIPVDKVSLVTLTNKLNALIILNLKDTSVKRNEHVCSREGILWNDVEKFNCNLNFIQYSSMYIYDNKNTYEQLPNVSSTNNKLAIDKDEQLDSYKNIIFNNNKTDTDPDTDTDTDNVEEYFDENNNYITGKHIGEGLKQNPVKTRYLNDKKYSNNKENKYKIGKGVSLVII
jgi:hypothetical protein